MRSLFFTETPVQYFTSHQVNAVKGLLILSVMLGHLRPLVGENFPVFQFVYNYHVICFLLLPFLYPIKQVDIGQIKTWVVRFWVPFTAFFVAYGALNYFVLGHNFGVIDVLKGYFIATPPMVDSVTGSEILWFLPHIFLVFLVFNFVMNKTNHFWFLLIMALIGHMLMGFIPKDIVSHVPFTALNILYLFFFGCIVRLIVLNLKENGQKYAWLFLVIFIGAQVISISTGSVLGYTGIYLFDISQPLKLLLCDILVISGFLAFLYGSFLQKIKLLNWLGKHSLIIFLVHQPFLFVAWKMLEQPNGKAEEVIQMYLYCVFAFIFTLIASAMSVLFFMKFKRLHQLIFPRSMGEWPKR